MNAFTSREVTAFHSTILKDNVSIAIDIISDILRDSVFDQEELEREKTVILQEIGQALDTPDEIIFDYFQSTAFPNQPLGHSVLGPRNNVENITRDTLLNFMREYYVSSRMIFSAAGNLEHAAIVSAVESNFSHIRNAKADNPVAAIYEGGDYRRIRDLEQAHLVIGFNSVGVHDPDFYAISVAASVLGGGMSSRLFQEIREKRGLVYSIYGFNSAYSDVGLFGIYAGTNESGLLDLIPHLCDELLKSSESIRERELECARAQIRTGIVMSLESTAARAEQIARQVALFGRSISIEEILTKVDALTCADIECAIKRLLSSSPTVAALGPVQNLLPYHDIEKRLKAA